MINKTLLVLVLTFIMIIFVSCGSTIDTKWGIDHELVNKIPTCNGDKSSTTNYINVHENDVIEKTIGNTILRICHYQNGDKLVCTVTGEAVIIYEK